MQPALFCGLSITYLGGTSYTWSLAMGILKASSSSGLHFIFLLLSLIIISGVQGRTAKDKGGFRPQKLFVFGDSYASAGNDDIPVRSWKVPYGITFPVVPTGRYSDGRVLTDFLAKYLGLKSPLACRLRSIARSRWLKYGMNFATGGTGVFDTVFPGPNMTTQIDLFQQLIEMKAASISSGLNSSIALVALSGNDYPSYLARNGSISGLPIIISRVMNQLAANLRRIYDLGVRKVVVSSLQPLGCLPSLTVSSGFQKCNSTFDPLVALHNSMLKRVLDKLNNETKDASTFLLLDVLQIPPSKHQRQANSAGLSSSKFENPLKPCCLGLSDGFICGSVDAATSNKMYTVCPNPKKAFFWDMEHPTQEGWRAVFDILKPSLQQVF
ncbi:hypothetical protein SAY87_027955 [Trapa incisa]|uniref:GDSL esterase/lipase n=1 Tax=Trapa incisa TaxID=236973 RepID=A0AAN7QP58_9MYRT|nr:hypothetical protein SAY87_027955 [Trapa incisa]